MALVTGALYWPTIRQDFGVLDDETFVVTNPGVNRGLSWEGAKWAFTNLYAGTWHPLTWLSHEADWSCYGSFAGGHHLTNLLLHTINTLLLFLLLRRLTGNTSASWIVAALFGWHPLRAESVAWIFERKDLLSTLCLLGTVWAYARYVQARQTETGPGSAERCPGAWKHYGLALAIFAAGLMCKPMLVTLPCLLLLLDYWPLRRAADPLAKQAAPAWAKLFAEKLPFFALGAGACLLTLAAQKGVWAAQTAEQASLARRVLNSLGAYGEYLRETIWPHPLCFYYPPASHLPVATTVGSALLLAAISWVAVRRRKDHPWLITGWLWFLGGLVPVIGLVQFGLQAAHADRYMYIPSIGLFVAVVWASQQLMRQWQEGRPIAVGLTATGLTACLALTHHQLQHWENNVELMTHTLAHTPNNPFSQTILGMAFSNAGKVPEAIAHYREALRIAPTATLARFRLGLELAETGQLEEAAQHFVRLLQRDPHRELLLNNLGVVLAQQGKNEQALVQFREAIRWNPGCLNAYRNAGTALQAMGDAGAALTNYTAALRIDPDSIDTLDRLAGLLARCPTPPYHRPEMAVRLAKRATAMSHDEMADYLDTLATAYAAAGQYTNAIAASQKAIQLANRHVMPGFVNKLQNDLLAYQARRNPDSDWKQARYSSVPASALGDGH
ncbi:MAG TPA: tetratricopeptide repeat protein [Dongiaceae bacterium]|nr:tetratricopeptide repeat protein [Dongiaceae bacterium]